VQAFKNILLACDLRPVIGQYQRRLEACVAEAGGHIDQALKSSKRART
jgi:hypothetical protein